MKKLLLVCLCSLMLFVTQAFAQNQTVSGTVTGKDDGLPIPGATVKIVGSTSGTQTNINGKFTLSAPSGATLAISYIGYQTARIAVSGPVINVALTSSSSQLNEVVVTGVGVATSKRKVAIDVATVSSKDFAKSATTSVDQALVGQIAGAQVQSTSGQPGTAALIILRGFTNLGSAQPLILIDGVQVSNDLLTYLDPTTVDHVEVVKGSAGGMLYGAQGGNGVIQIFTKKGVKNSKLTIDISTKASVDNVLTGSRPLVAKDNFYVTDAAGNILDASGKPIAHDAYGVWTDPQTKDFTGDPTVQNNTPFNMPVYDHVQQAFKTAYTFSNSVNIRGGTETADYAFSASNLNQQDVFSNNYNRTNLGLNFGFTPAKGLSIRNSTQLIYTHEDLLGGNRFNLVQTPQYINLKFVDPTGNYVVKPTDIADGENSLSEKDYHERHSNTPRIVENIDVNYKLPKFLELDYKYSLDYRSEDTYDYYKNQSNLPDGETVFWGPTQGGAIEDQWYTSLTQYSIGSAFIRTDFKKDFHLNIPIKTTTQLSYDYRKEDDQYYYIEGLGLTPYPPVTIGGATTKVGNGDNGSNATQSTLMYGYLVNQTIDYANLVGISGGFRSDYSSVFGSGSKPFTFPRGTIYFNPSELLKLSFLPNWKVRGAYGEAGVQPNAYNNQLTLGLNPLGTSGIALTTNNTASNPGLRVQVTKELEVGTDFTVLPSQGDWFSRINISGSYWNRKSNDDIQTAPVAPSTGFTGTLDNLVSLKATGIDLSIDANTFKSENFTWDLGFRFATSKTIVTKLSNNLPITIGTFQLAEGQQLGELYGQTPLHSVNQLMPDGTRYIPTTDVGFYTLVNGNVVDTRTNTALLTASNDLSYMGNTNPNFTSSIINRFTVYKRLGVSFQFDWIHGNKIYNQTRQWLYRDEISKDFDQPVTINGKTGAFVAYYESFYNALSPDSWFVEDGSFVRLRDASVSYDLTGLTHAAKWIRTLDVTLSGRNLLTFTKYHGLDPENTGAVNNQGGSLGNVGQYRGVDYFGAPNVRSYQLTLNIGF